MYICICGGPGIALEIVLNVDDLLFTALGATPARQRALVRYKSPLGLARFDYRSLLGSIMAACWGPLGSIMGAYWG